MICMLQTIEALVGDADEQVHGVAVRWKCGDAVIEAYIDGNFDGAQNVVKNDADAFAECQCLRGVSLRKQESKFVAAETKRGVRRAQGFSQRGCDRAQNIVTAEMTEMVVHFLEAMEVEGDEAERLRVTLCAIQFFLKRFTEETPVVKTSQWVGDRVAFQRL